MFFPNKFNNKDKCEGVRGPTCVDGDLRKNSNTPPLYAFIRGKFQDITDIGVNRNAHLVLICRYF